MKTVIVLEIESTASIPDLADIAAGRVYTLAPVRDVTARVLDAEDAALLQQIDAKRQRRAYNAANNQGYEPFAYTERS